MPFTEEIEEYIARFKERVALFNPVHIQISLQHILCQKSSSYVDPFLENEGAESLRVKNRGYCIALVPEWYRYRHEKRDFFAKLESPTQDEFNRLNFLRYHINVHRNQVLMHKLSQASLFGLFASNTTIVRVMVHLEDSYHFYKLYGLESHRVAVQWNRGSSAILAHKTNPEETEHWFYSNVGKATNFSKILDQELDDIAIGAFKHVIYLTYDANGPGIGHCIGITALISDDGQSHYLLYDPDIGEVTFSCLKNLRDFLQSELYNNENLNKYSSIILNVITYDSGIKPSLHHNSTATTPSILATTKKCI